MLPVCRAMGLTGYVYPDSILHSCTAGACGRANSATLQRHSCRCHQLQCASIPAPRNVCIGRQSVVSGRRRFGHSWARIVAVNGKSMKAGPRLRALTSAASSIHSFELQLAQHIYLFTTFILDMGHRYGHNPGAQPVHSLSPLCCGLAWGSFPRRRSRRRG